MDLLKSRVAQVATLAFGAFLIIPVNFVQALEQGSKKPSLSLKASPAVSFAPARVVIVAELKGGADDSEELYCPTVEWEWGDLTTSTQEADCEPYAAGKSTIKRRFTVEHQFRNPGGFKVVLRLKKGQKVVASANTLVQVRPGLGQD
ncbi:MAG TPA: hypothetical protein VEC39_08695 [Vicinamibacterales bacterium]|nr:hypothetical protein [Vicinamibacterales bacterium]